MFGLGSLSPLNLEGEGEERVVERKKEVVELVVHWNYLN